MGYEGRSAMNRDTQPLPSASQLLDGGLFFPPPTEPLSRREAPELVADASPSPADEDEVSQETDDSSASAHIPRWKRILDLTCILLALPVWPLLMIVITLWIKL